MFKPVVILLATSRNFIVKLEGVILILICMSRTTRKLKFDIRVLIYIDKIQIN